LKLERELEREWQQQLRKEKTRDKLAQRQAIRAGAVVMEGRCLVGGAKVKIIGLTSEEGQKLNGTEGVIDHWSEERGLFATSLPGGSRMIKKENLEVLEAPDALAPSGKLGGYELLEMAGQCKMVNRRAVWRAFGGRFERLERYAFFGGVWPAVPTDKA
jgi:hypothetical protein